MYFSNKYIIIINLYIYSVVCQSESATGRRPRVSAVHGRSGRSAHALGQPPRLSSRGHLVQDQVPPPGIRAVCRDERDAAEPTRPRNLAECCFVQYNVSSSEPLRVSLLRPLCVPMHSCPTASRCDRFWCWYGSHCKE